MYLDGKKFSALFHDPQANHNDICEGIFAIAQHLVQKFHISKSRLSLDDADLEDMASFATIIGISKINYFDFNASDNAFAFFTTVLFNAMRQWLKNHQNNKRTISEFADAGAVSHYSPDSDAEPILPMTVYQVCQRLNISKSTLNAWREIGFIDAVPGWRQDKFRFMYDEYNVTKLEKKLAESRQRHHRYQFGLELAAGKLNTIQRASSVLNVHESTLHVWISKNVVVPLVVDGQLYIHDDELPKLQGLVEQAKVRAAHPLMGVRLILNNSMLPSEAATALKIHGCTLQRWVQHGLIRRRQDGMYDRAEVERVSELLLQYQAQQYIGRSLKYFKKHLRLGNIAYVCAIGNHRWFAKSELDRFMAETVVGPA